MTFFQGCLSGLSIFEVNGEFASLWMVNFFKSERCLMNLKFTLKEIHS